MSALAMQLFVALYRGLFCIHTKDHCKSGTNNRIAKAEMIVRRHNFAPPVVCAFIMDINNGHYKWTLKMDITNVHLKSTLKMVVKNGH
jgi:hypothetical protein